MTLYLRNQKNQTIVDIEFYKKENYLELKSVIVIDTYSEFLLSNLDRKNEIIKTFDYLSELRGWLWEIYFMKKRNTIEKYNDVLSTLKIELKRIAKEFNLLFITD